MPVNNVGNLDPLKIIGTGQAGSRSRRERRPTLPLRGTLGEASGREPQDSSRVSLLAQLMSELAQLQESDPETFKQLAAQIAVTLHEAADAVGGSDGQALQRVATQFRQASQTGLLPSPADAPPSPGLHGYGAQAAVGGLERVRGIVEATFEAALEGLFGEEPE
jgi:hypothetical protein